MDSVLHKARESHWRWAETFFAHYRANEPLAVFLRNTFRAHPFLGARDRRSIREICFCVCRAFHTHDGYTLRERMHKLKTEGFTKIMEEVMRDPARFFPCLSALSPRVNAMDFVRSFFVRPAIFIRLRRSVHAQAYVDRWTAGGLSFTRLSEFQFCFTTETDLSRWVRSEDYIVQDIASQCMGDFLMPETGQLWWDACAGAGGKTLLLYEKNPALRVWATDIRAHVLRNYHARMIRYDYPAPVRADVCDLSVSAPEHFPYFDGILLDVPCTGSGTWLRTPEQKYFFDDSKIAHYVRRQRAIVKQVSTRLKEGGKIYYSTCSVFAQENEACVHTLAQACRLNSRGEHYLSHTRREGVGETIFLSVFEKP